MDKVHLTSLFLGDLGPAARARVSDLATLEACLERVLHEGRSTWPTVALQPERFLPFLAARVPEGEPVAALGGMALSDLYLACACLRGDSVAIAAFEAAYFPMVEAALAGVRASPSQIDEVKQALRAQLFVAGPTGEPSLVRYSGHGALGGWVRVTAVRAALRLMNREKRAVSPRPELIEALPAPELDPALAQLKDRYRVEFKEAFQTAVRALSRRDRNLLRYHHFDELTVDDIGALYRVHRTTAARWVARARQTVLDETRRALTARLKVGQSEFKSIMRLIQSQLHVSLSFVLPAEVEEEPAEGSDIPGA
jgi:RNA polymerase sigma-70 factor, ECF subfamily